MAPSADIWICSNVVAAQSLVPVRMYVSLYHSDAVEGDMTKSPYETISPKSDYTSDTIGLIKSITCLLGGENSDNFVVPDHAFEPCMYVRLLRTLGLASDGLNNGLDREAFRNGSFYAAFDFSTSGRPAGQEMFNSVRLGELRLQIQLAKAVPANLQVLCLMEYASCISVHSTSNSGRVIQTNYLT